MMKSAAPITRRRLILTALLSLIVILILSGAGLTISSRRDPIVGTWSKVFTDPSPDYALGHDLRFSPDGTLVCLSDPTILRGTWEAVAGPLYFHRGNRLYQITGENHPNFLRESDLAPKHFQQAQATGVLNLLPESEHFPLYRVQQPPHSAHYLLLPRDGLISLYIYRGHASYQRPETWLTRARAWLRSILPP